MKKYSMVKKILSVEDGNDWSLFEKVFNQILFYRKKFDCLKIVENLISIFLWFFFRKVAFVLLKQKTFHQKQRAESCIAKVRFLQGQTD